MVTASHNGPQDNGFKIVDPSGSMLDASWESVAEALANAKTADAVQQIVTEDAKGFGLAALLLSNADGQHVVAKVTPAPVVLHVFVCTSSLFLLFLVQVLVGRDTRYSGEILSRAVEAGASAIGVQAHVIDLPVTTPELHYRVATSNLASVYFIFSFFHLFTPALPTSRVCFTRRVNKA